MARLDKTNSSKNRNSFYEIKGVDFPCPNSTLHALLQEQSDKTPTAIALQFGDNRISYRELTQRINQTAHYLWSEGVRPNQVVAISLDRSPELIVSIFAVLQCGASYVPIDTSYPDGRLDLMVDDSEARVLISSTKRNRLSHCAKTILIDELLKATIEISTEPLDVKVSTKSAAYIIYTSGSTGKPKGVQVAHGNVINLVYSMGKEPGITASDKIFAVTTISFDAMIMEIFLPLLHGASVVLVDEETRRDGQLLLKKAVEDQITVIWGTPTIWQILLDSGWEKPLSIKALIGGEPIPLPLAHELISLTDELWNIYGPTETTVCAFLTKITKEDNPITIGKPVANTHAYLLDIDSNPVAEGEIGEIVIGGAGVSLGYLNRPELNAKSFISDPYEKEGSKMYHSGDLGKLLPNGQVQCLGRRDNQVKVRGHRIELGEIEVVLAALQSIKRAVVIVSKDLGAEPRLVAYLQAKDQDQDIIGVRKHLAEVLPDYYVPSFYMWVTEFPMTTNGKIDTEKLPTPEFIRPDSAPLLRKARTFEEKEIAKIWSEQLQVPVIGIDDNFFEMGGTSLLTQKVATIMRKRLKIKVPVTKIYQHPTIAELAISLGVVDKTKAASNFSNPKNKKFAGDVAVIGMAGRFPGATTIKELWQVLSEGKETTTFFTPEELDKSLPASLRNDPMYVAARGIIPSANTFDAAFFGLNPKLASAMDPQLRLFLEIAWEALEQSGHLPKHYKGSIGVYAGTGTNTYYKNNVLPNEELVNQVGHLLANTVNEKDYISSRTAYHLNLTGPAVSVQSACSTSLLAIAEAVESIRSGQCDIALAGGSSVTAPMNSGHLYQEGSMLSSDGHSRTFDVKATGTVFSDGAGVVLLKSLAAAKKDGDTIYGLIKGVGINNDGGNKGSFTAPSVDGQANAIRRALNDAQVSPSTISYIEAHGTATPLGDPIEMEGLHMAFGKQEQNNFCAVGSVKSNMGHLTGAAGVTGIIKTILALHNQQIPASLGFSEPNPAIDFENSPFFVNTELRQWNVDTVRRAGVSSFGVGGTNVHIVLEEYEMEKKAFDTGRPLQLLPWSAKTDTSLSAYGTELGIYLNSTLDAPLADVAYALNMTRGGFNHRQFVLSNSTSDAAQQLLEATNTRNKNILKVAPNEIAFLFPGQGAQYLQMGRALYAHEKVFREAVDICAELLMDELTLDIRKLIYPETDSDDAEKQLKNTRFTQPALFVVEYALAQLWISWGITPTLYCGHSIGEFVGAHLAGVFSLKDALHLIATRGRLVSELPGGSMLSVRLSADEVLKILPDTLSIAAMNSDKLCVVSGADTDVEDFAKKLKTESIPHKLLLTSHAFHSEMMDPVLETFRDEVEKVSLKAPNTPIVSTVTGTWLTEEEAQSPEYWTNHLRATVRFTDAVTTISSLEDVILLEIGPGRALTTLSRQNKEAKSLTAISSLDVPKKDEGSYSSVLTALGKLWMSGMEPDWSAFYAGQSRQKVALPSYVFDRKPCWVNPILSQPIATVTHAQISNTPIMPVVMPNVIETKNALMRKSIILEKISELISNASGIEMEIADANHSFLELGLDSLILTQIALTCKKEFKVPITFRQLNEEFGTPELLASHLDQSLPPEIFAQAPSAVKQTAIANGAPLMTNIDLNAVGNPNSALNLIAQQLQFLGTQVAALQGQGNAVSAPLPTNNLVKSSPRTEVPSVQILSEDEQKEHSKPFGASPRIERKSTDLNEKQQDFLEKLIQSYNKKTNGSKAYSQEHRSNMADPRVVSGFKPLTKELIYPLVIGKSSGNKMWDLDGNQYIDALNGFGSCIFGHQPDFIKEALKMQIESGYEVGPQHPLAGEVCDLLCEFTGHERAALCNTGSEAVLGAMRIARTATGRSLVVAFSGSYHGINDEGIVRGSKKLKTFPAAAGIMPEAVQNMLILDYGTEESLNIIRERALELAAVLVEPIQSRRPEFVPLEFLKEVREITKESETALIFDEVITGFRIHPGGFQAEYGIKADLAAYGKVIGGGLSIGAILGKKLYMDALDGGFWQYGDNSYPEVGVTYFAGTFVRHPLALAASKASLLHMKEQGGQLQKNLTLMTERLAYELNLEFAKRKLPMEINHFSSLWRLKMNEEVPYSELLFVLLREKGIHIWDGFPCFITEAYVPEDVNFIIKTILNSLEEMVTAGFFTSTLTINENGVKPRTPLAKLNKPPVSGARLGMDESGNPAWFVADAKQENGYIKIDI